MHHTKKNFIKNTSIYMTVGFAFALSFATDQGSLLPLNSMEIKAIETDTKQIEPLNEEPTVIDTGKDSIAIGKILDTVFEDGYSQVSEAKKIESSDLSKSTYAIDSMIFETVLDFDKLGDQTGTKVVYDQGASNVDSMMILSTNETEPLKELDKNIKHNFTVEVDIKDTTAPEIHLTTNEILLDNGEEIKPEEWIDYIWDNVDCEITEWEFDENDLDINTGGHYTGIYTAQDSSGNTSTAYLYIAVKEKEQVSRIASYSASIASYSAGANTSGSIYELANLINS